MLITSDITYSGVDTERVASAIAFGIDGEVVHTLATYVDFYEFLIEHPEVICATEDCGTVTFVVDGKPVETLNTTPLLGSILASNPDILEIVRRNPDNSMPEVTEELRFKRAVVPGWRYDSTGFIAPEGWVMPPAMTAEQEERAKEILRLRGETNV